jgi:hypothetical protein
MLRKEGAVPKMPKKKTLTEFQNASNGSTEPAESTAAADLVTIDEILKAPSETDDEAALRLKSVSILKAALDTLVKPGMVRSAADHQALMLRLVEAFQPDTSTTSSSTATRTTPTRRRGPGRPRKTTPGSTAKKTTRRTTAAPKTFSPNAKHQKEAQKLLKGDLGFDKAHTFLKALHLTKRGRAPQNETQRAERLEAYKTRIEQIAAGSPIAK